MWIPVETIYAFFIFNCNFNWYPLCIFFLYLIHEFRKRSPFRTWQNHHQQKSADKFGSFYEKLILARSKFIIQILRLF
jgi:hypothetical protein